MSRISLIACLLIVCMFSSMHVTNALWQQKKYDEFRRNNINLNVKHQDWSVKGAVVGDGFAEFKSTLVVDEKAALAYIATTNSSNALVLQIDLTSGQQKVISIPTLGRVYPIGAVLDENGYYYLLSKDWNEDDTTVISKINTKTGQTFSRSLPEFGGAYSISLTTDKSILIVARKMIGSFRRDTFYEYWIIKQEDEYVGLDVTSLLVNKEMNNEDMLYVLTHQSLAKYRVKDGSKLGSIPVDVNTFAETLVYLGKPNLIAFTRTNVARGGLSYLSIVNFETRQVSTTEIITNSKGVFPGPSGCDYPTFFGRHPDFKQDKFDIFVSCETYRAEIFNIYANASILNSNNNITSIQVEEKKQDILLGATLIPKSNTFISKKISGGDYIITDVKGNILSNIKSSINGDSCEIVTSGANNRLYAFCRVGPNEVSMNVESRSLPSK